jgi:hypothetical protein
MSIRIDLSITFISVIIRDVEIIESKKKAIVIGLRAKSEYRETMYCNSRPCVRFDDRSCFSHLRSVNLQECIGIMGPRVKIAAGRTLAGAINWRALLKLVDQVLMHYPEWIQKRHMILLVLDAITSPSILRVQ